MKGKKLFTSNRVWKAGSVFLAAVVLGTSAWSVDAVRKEALPELTSFIDLEDQISIGEEEVPLASVPKTSVKTKTSVTRKVVALKKKSTRTYTRILKPKKISSPTTTKTSANATTITKKVTTIYVTEKYKKNSKLKTIVTTKKVKTTITTIKKTAAAAAKTKVSSTAAADTKSNTVSTNTAVSGKNLPYTVDVAKLAPLVDSRVRKAYQELHFDISINGSVSYTGYFDARNQSITLREENDTVYHELGHFVAFLTGNVDKKADFQAIYQEEKNLFTGSRRVYASQSASEFFAECFREYTLNPSALKSCCPKTYEAITSALNKITDSFVSQVKAFYGIIWTK